jgi:hypothetical protein
MALQGLGRRLRSLRRVHGFKSLHNSLEEAIPSSARLQQVLQPLRTLHSLFWLPVKQKKSDLSNATLQLLQSLFQDIRFIIIDEKSIIDLKILSIIDDCLRLIFPDQLDQAFGGLNVLLYRDFFQLPPVNGRSLYATKVTGPIAIKGQGLYQSFDRTIRLTQVMW